MHILSGAEVPPFNKDFVRNVLRMGHGLIVADDQKIRFIFAHLSVKEFFENRADFSCEHAHAVAAEACLSLYSRADFAELRSQGFRSYAWKHISRHCQKAGILRNGPKLQSLMHGFLLEQGLSNAFELWHRDSHADGKMGIDQETIRCWSEPPLPLFMVCVYGFEEYVEHLILHREEILLAKNSWDETPLEVATEYGSYNIVKALYKCSSSARISPIKPESWIQNAARCKDFSSWCYVVDHTPNEVSKTALTLPAGNPTLGTLMVARLLENMTAIDTETLDDLFRTCASLATVDMVLSHPVATVITNSILEAAVQNPTLNPELIDHVLSIAPYLRVTDACFALAFHAKKCWTYSTSSVLARVIKKLLSHHSRSEITEEIVCGAILFSSDYDIDCLDQLIELSLVGCITEDILAAAVMGFFVSRAHVHTYLLDHPRGIKISQQIVRTAISNGSLGSRDEVRKVLTRPECPPVSEEPSML